MKLEVVDLDLDPKRGKLLRLGSMPREVVPIRTTLTATRNQL